MAAYEDVSSNGFYLTLLSNSSTNFFPNNKASSFTVQLSNEIRLNSPNWEVGLADILFPPTWENITAGSNIVDYSFNLIISKIPSMYGAVPSLSPTKYHFKENSNWKSDVDIDITFSMINVGESVYKYSIYHIHRANLKIPKGNYDNIQILLDTINNHIWKDMNNLIENLNREISDFNYVMHKATEDDLTKEKDDFFKKQLSLHYDKELRRVIVTSLSGNARLTFDTDLVEVLGFMRGGEMENENDSNMGVGLTAGENLQHEQYKTANSWKIRASFPPHLQEMSVFLYTDIIKHQYVGDSKVELLQTIPINRAADINFVHYLYNKPQYVPVSRERFQTIAVDLRTHFGTLFNFEGGDTFIKLHFRPIRPLF